MSAQDGLEPAGDPPGGAAVCKRARRCPGWLVSEDCCVRRCRACRALASDEHARESALAAGLDVQRSGFVAGVSGVRDERPEGRSDEHRAVASLNGLLVVVLDQLMAAHRLPHLPGPMRSCVDQLMVEVARVQGVSEWVSEDLVRLVEEDDAEE